MSRRLTNDEVRPWLHGVWRRDRVERGDGSVDRDSRVVWLQTPTLYADIRVPRDRRAPQGFAGRLTVTGQVCSWHRPIDLQPPPHPPDVGAMFRRGRRMIECGIHANYLEDWRLVDDGGGRFLAMARGGAKMTEVLVVAGNHFIAARAAEGSRPCELSYGRIGRANAWRITLSTTSAREGCRLFDGETWRFDSRHGQALQRTPRGGPWRHWRVWSCTLAPRLLARLFPNDG